MRLLRVELTRLRWRRAVLLLVIAGLLIPALVWASAAWNTRSVSQDEVDQANAEQRAMMQREVDRCIADPEGYGMEPGTKDVARTCQEWMGGNVDVTAADFRRELSIAELADGEAETVAVFLMMLAVLVGTTFAGADWSSGSLSNQLLFDPRRTRVWAAKAGAVALGALALAAAGIGLFWMLAWGLAEARDISTTSAVWRSVGGDALRTVLLAAAGALGSFSLTMFFRSTVASLGVLLAVAIVGSLLIDALPIDGTGRWMLHHNVLGVFANGYDYWDYSECPDIIRDDTCAQVTLTLGEGVRYLGVMLVAAVALSALSFRRRDVP